MGTYVDLLKACKEGSHKKVKKLLENCTDICDVRDLTDKTLLHYCFKYELCAELILQAAPELLDVGEKNGYTVLHLASMIKPPTSLKFLLSKNPDINKRNNDSRSSLLLAVIYDNPEAVKILCEHKAEVNIRDINGVSPLHYAAKVKVDNNCEVETHIISILLEYGAHIDDLDFYDRSPLMWAVCSNNIVKMKYLIEKGANIYSKDSGGLSVLHYATSNGNGEIIKLLLDDYKFDLETLDSNHCTVLMYACSYNNVEIIELLLEKGSNVNAEDCKRRNAAHFASGKGDLKNLECLYRFNVDLWKLNNDSNYPIHEAAYKGHVEIVEFLIQHLEHDNQFLIVINHKNSNGQTPLHLCTVKDNLQICKILLENGADPNIPLRVSNGKSLTALDLANQEETKRLISDYKGKTSDDLWKTSVINEEPTRSISDEESSEIDDDEIGSIVSDREINESDSGNEDKLIDDNVSIEKTSSKSCSLNKENNNESIGDNTQQTINESFYETESLKINENNNEVQKIQKEIEFNQSKSEIESFNYSIDSPLANFESENNKLELTQNQSNDNCMPSNKMINSIANEKRDIWINEDNKIHLLQSIYEGNVEEILYLIKNGVNLLEITDKIGRTVLHYSLKNSNLFETIIQKAPELVNKCDETNVTILHMVVMSKETERLPSLLANKADINFPDNNGRTALHLAAIYKNLEALDFMNNYFQDKTQFHHLPDHLGNYPLHNTVEFCKANKSVCQCKRFIELFLEMNANIECRDKINRTPLLLAINLNHIEAVSTLLRNGADYMAKDSQHLCSIHYACSEGNLEILNELIALDNFDSNIQDPNGLTPIFYAVSNCNEKVVKKLIEFNAKIDIVDRYGRNLCHKAAEKGAFKCLELLLSYNVDPWWKAKDKTMPLHEAAYRGYKEVAEILLNTVSAAENINLKNSSGQTALHLAAARNDCPMCYLLISKGSNINELLHSDDDCEDLTAYDLATTPYCKDTLRNFGGRSAKRIIDCIESEVECINEDNFEEFTIMKDIDYENNLPVSIRSTELALSTIPSVVYTTRTNEVFNCKNSNSIHPIKSSKTSSRKSEITSKLKISISSTEKSPMSFLSTSECKQEIFVSPKNENYSTINKSDTERDMKHHQERLSSRKKTNLSTSSEFIEPKRFQSNRTNSSSGSEMKKSSTRSKFNGSFNKKQIKQNPTQKIMEIKIQNSVINYEYIRLNCKIANELARLKIREENIEKLTNPKISKLRKVPKPLKPILLTK